MEQPQQRLFSNKQLWMLIIPLILENNLGILVGMVDGIMVSSVGEAAISAVSLVANISRVILYLFSALAAGGAIVTSQFLGAKCKEDARHSAGQLMTMAVGVSVVLSGLLLIFRRQILLLFFGQIEADVLEAAVVYFSYSAYSYPFLALYNGCAAIMRTRGNSKVSLYVSLLRNVVNVAGNALCIYGLKMGVEGVAIPTAISRVVGAVVMLAIVMRSDPSLRPRMEDIFHIQPKLMGRMLRVGLPTAFESSAFQLGKVLTLGMISGFGTYQIAANSTANALTGFVVTCVASVRTASMTVIGQCVGARDETQLNYYFRKLFTIAYAIHGVVALLFLIFRYQLLGLYQNLSPETVELAAKLLSIHLCSAIFLYPVAFFIASPLRAVNDSSFPMILTIVTMVIFRLGLGRILCVELEWGAVGVWVAMVVDWAVRGICLVTRWRSGVWKKKCNLTPLPQAKAQN